jgi:hypothetical protein
MSLFNVLRGSPGGSFCNLQPRIELRPGSFNTLMAGPLGKVCAYEVSPDDNHGRIYYDIPKNGRRIPFLGIALFSGGATAAPLDSQLIDFMREFAFMQRTENPRVGGSIPPLAPLISFADVH